MVCDIPEHASRILQKAFSASISTKIDMTSHISEAVQLLNMETMLQWMYYIDGVICTITVYSRPGHVYYYSVLYRRGHVYYYNLECFPVISEKIVGF